VIVTSNKSATLRFLEKCLRRNITMSGSATNGYKDKYYEKKLTEHDVKIKELESKMSALNEAHAVIEYATRDLKNATEKIDEAVDRLGEKLDKKIERIRNNPEIVVQKQSTIKEKTMYTSLGTAFATGAAYLIKLLMG
jgi:predicted  nucleic acid-binding Zn-ribbon protein